MKKPASIKTQLRMPATLQDQLVAATEKSGRSMNAEIVSRLMESLEGVVSQAQHAALLSRVRELEKEISSFREMRLLEARTKRPDLESGAADALEVLDLMLDAARQFHAASAYLDKVDPADLLAARNVQKAVPKAAKPRSRKR